MGRRRPRFPKTACVCGVRAQSGVVAYPQPRPLDAAGIKAVVGAYRQAARNAIDAGFDGVEIHGWVQEE
jgi:2,4-dienoyl-CoA reductase-like NADH-dependent reductase (Old Yellow Enzyme family)